MTEEPDSSNNVTESTPVKLRLQDKIWVAVVITIFVIAFILIVIYDFI